LEKKPLINSCKKIINILQIKGTTSLKPWKDHKSIMSVLFKLSIIWYLD